METNKYLEQYMRLVNEQSESQDALKGLCWEDKTWGIKVEPEYFNYFSFKITTNLGGSTLQIEKARELAKWLLDVTEGLDNTHGIITEIIKRRMKYDLKT